MSELQDLINKLQVNANRSDSYVYYSKDTGKIHKISSKKTPCDEYEIVAIPNEEVKPILTGEKRTDEFVIFYDVSLKQVRLKEVAYEDSHKTASTMCYQLPVVKYDDTDEYLLDFTKKITYVPEYLGMHIDVWYDELPHLAGQHVWVNNTVYKLINNQAENTKFTTDNAELIVDNVALYADENELLATDTTKKDGKSILKNNKIFRIKIEDCNINTTTDIVMRQDTDAGEWQIKINPHTKKFLIHSGYNPQETLYFSVTSKYDPNILYRSLEFTVGDLLDESTSIIPFKYDVERNANNVSIYTAKYFENYAHEII